MLFRSSNRIESTSLVIILTASLAMELSQHLQQKLAVSRNCFLASQTPCSLATYRCKTHSKQIVSVEWDAKVGVESEHGVCDARKQFLEAASFSGKGCESSIANDAVGMITKDILSVRFEDLASV